MVLYREESGEEDCDAEAEEEDEDEYTEREMIVTRNQHIQATPYTREYGTQTRQIIPEPLPQPKTHNI